MELSPNLNKKSFTWSDKSTLSTYLGELYSDEIKERADTIAKLLIKSYKSLIDPAILSLFEQYPEVFYTTNCISLDSKVFGITEGDYYKKPSVNKYGKDTQVDGSISISIKTFFPSYHAQIFKITKDNIDKIDPTILEQIRQMFSEILEFKYKRKVEVDRYYDIKDEIRTIGRLYRVDPELYKILVLNRYPEEAGYVAPEKSPDKKARSSSKLDDKSKAMLEDLKGLIKL